MNDLEIQNKSQELMNSIMVEQKVFSDRYGNVKVFYISDIHLLHHIDKTKDIDLQIREIAKNLFSDDLIFAINNRKWVSYLIVFLGDICSNSKIEEKFFRAFKYFYTCYKKNININEINDEELVNLSEKSPIIVILGNHELNSFSNVNETVGFHRDIFEKLGILFLHNAWGVYKSTYIEKRFYIYGGIGFAKYNEQFNATNLCTTQPPLSREEEKIESNLFYEEYQKSAEMAKKDDRLLFVFSHYPVHDWLNGPLSSNCIYFCGHNHCNNIKTENKTQIYADNQIGYSGEKIKFKCRDFGFLYNPYYDLKDGYYETNVEQYKIFNAIVNEPLMGVDVIDRLVKSNNGKFYVIKRSNFYGFFIISDKNAKICFGGRAKIINEITNIKYFYESFDKIVQKYISTLQPYRKVQEEISNELKYLGFDGNIHGTIVDIDFYNHIMINPTNGEVGYYYSPIFGVAKSYQSFRQLVEDQFTNRIESTQKLLKDYCDKNNPPFNIDMIKNDIQDSINQYVKIDIKNSPYVYSFKMEQLQRLFRCNILRDWNDEWAQEIMGNKYLPTGEGNNNDLLVQQSWRNLKNVPYEERTLKLVELCLSFYKHRIPFPYRYYEKHFDGVRVSDEEIAEFISLIPKVVLQEKKIFDRLCQSGIDMFKFYPIELMNDDFVKKLIHGSIDIVNEIPICLLTKNVCDYIIDYYDIKKKRKDIQENIWNIIKQHINKP